MKERKEHGRTPVQRRKVNKKQRLGRAKIGIKTLLEPGGGGVHL